MLIESSLTATYAATWTVTHALREILQNYLDLQDVSPAGRLHYAANGCLTVADKGPGIATRHLALGVSEKCSPDAIGQFGEGLKLALLVLARECRQVEIISQGKRIAPRFCMSAAYGIETLQYSVEPAPQSPGTTIHIQCSYDEYRAARAYFLVLDETATRVSRKSLIYAQPKGAYIYGSRIMQSSTSYRFLFGYDVREPDARSIMNRDRNAVDRTAIRGYMRLMLSQETSPRVIDAVLHQVESREPSEETSLDWCYATFTILAKRAWAARLHAQHGKKVCASFDPETDQLATYQGWTVLKTDFYSAGLYRQIGIPDAQDAIHAQRSGQDKPRKIPMTALDPDERAALRYAMRITRKHYTDLGKVIVVDFSEPTRLGEYDSKDDVIRVARKALAGNYRALHVLLHESCHRTSGETDLSHEFEERLLGIAVHALMVTYPPKD